jgi:[lysine-biosynthesis-protein LysW]--L-2-aminoadipate ligase
LKELVHVKVGIILNKVSFEEKELILALEEKGHKVVQLNNQRLYLPLRKPLDGRSEDFLKDIKESDVIIQRSLSLTRGLYSSAILECLGKKVVNSYDTIRICGDKLLTTLKLIENGVNTPSTSVAFTTESAIECIEKDIHYPAVIKPIIGSWGRMIAKLESKNMATAVLEDRDTMGDIFQKVIYLQKFISKEDRPKNAATDIRVFYVDGKCLGAMGRYQQGDEFRSNIAIGGKGGKIDLTPEMEKVACKAAKAVNGEILGVDLMETNNGYTCIEVNGTPQFQGFATTTGVNPAKVIVEYLERKYK